MLALVAALALAPNDATVESLMRSSHVVGATIAIVRDGQVVSLRAYGVRDITTQQPTDAHTQYETGSLTREFTAAATVQLVEARKIDLDAPVARYIPNAPHASEITVRQLLDNTSGLPPYAAARALQQLRAHPRLLGRLMARISG